MLDKIASRRPAVRVPHDPATLHQRVLVDVLRKGFAGARPAGLDAYSLPTLQAAWDYLGNYPEPERLRVVLQRELDRRQGLAESQAHTTLDALPKTAAQPPVGEMPAIFRSTPSSACEEQVRRFLHAAVHGPMQAEVAAEIEFFEQLARDLESGLIDLRHLPALQARAPRSSPPRLLSLYLDMSPEAARLCMVKRMDDIQSNAAGPASMLENVLEPCALALASGEEAMTGNDAASHTLRHSITLRLAQIQSLPGAARIRRGEMARRVACSFREPEFLLDAHLDLHAGMPGYAAWQAMAAIATIDAFERGGSEDDH